MITFYMTSRSLYVKNARYLHEHLPRTAGIGDPLQFLESSKQHEPLVIPANICPIVPITFYKAGTPIEFVDISSETLHMDLEKAEARLSQGSFGGILYAHT